MPIYEYQCEACQHHLEALQKISDAPLRKCPECGKSRLRRLISPPVFRLKGSGWYETDFKSDKENKRNLAVEKEEAAAPDDSKAKAAETKPASGPAATSTEASTETPKPAAAASASRKPAARSKARSRPRPARKRAR
jgi:putative FmdB family regulatory protein